MLILSQDTVVLGGTHDKDQWDTKPKEKDAQFILKGCTALFPSLEVPIHLYERIRVLNNTVLSQIQKAEIVQEWVGLRPGRQSLRVELEKMTVNGRRLTVKDIIICDFVHLSSNQHSFLKTKTGDS